MAHELDARRQPRRAGDDARRLLRHDRRVHRPVRLPLRRRHGDDDDNPSVAGRSSSSRSSSTSISFLLMQALSRYREFAADRGAALITGRPSALASALHEDLERHGPHPAARPARARSELSAFYIFPPGAKKRDRRPVRDAPADGEADRGAPAPRERSCRARARPSHGLPRHPHRQAEAQAAGREPAVRDVDGRRHAGDDARAQELGQGGDRLPAARDGRLRPTIVRDMEEVLRGTGEDTGTTVETSDDAFGYRWMVLDRPGLRGPRRRRQRRLGGARGRRLRRPRPGRGVRVPRREGPARSTSSTTTSAARSTRSCPPAASSSATPSASCGSRRRSAASCRSSPSSSAGSRSGASRSSSRGSPTRGATQWPGAHAHRRRRRGARRDVPLDRIRDAAGRSTWRLLSRRDVQLVIHDFDAGVDAYTEKLGRKLPSTSRSPRWTSSVTARSSSRAAVRRSTSGWTRTCAASPSTSSPATCRLARSATARRPLFYGLCAAALPRRSRRWPATWRTRRHVVDAPDVVDGTWSPAALAGHARVVARVHGRAERSAVPA